MNQQFVLDALLLVAVHKPLWFAFIVGTAAAIVGSAGR